MIRTYFRVHGNGEEKNEVRITFKDHHEWVISNPVKDGRYDFYGTDNRHWSFSVQFLNSSTTGLHINLGPVYTTMEKCTGRSKALAQDMVI